MFGVLLMALFTFYIGLNKINVDSPSTLLTLQVGSTEHIAVHRTFTFKNELQLRVVS